MAVHVPDRAALSLPRPLRAATPLAALAAAALALDAAPGLPWVAGVAAALLFATAAAVRAVQEERELRRIRGSADRLILLGQAHPGASGVVVWRSEELTRREHRRLLAREVERTLRYGSTDRLPAAAPVNRGAARASGLLLRRVADRLDDEQPVTARGILLAEQLLRDPSSPLYDPDADEPLAHALAHTLHALEP